MTFAQTCVATRSTVNTVIGVGLAAGLLALIANQSKPQPRRRRQLARNEYLFKSRYFAEKQLSSNF
jgi:hypothetical protein